MTALAAGTKAPDIELKTMDGKKFSLQAELARGPVVLVFSKLRAPHASMPFPFRAAAQGLRARRTSPWLAYRRTTRRKRRLHQTVRDYFPGAARRHPLLSGFECLRPDQRPEIFWVAQDGEIEVSSVGWVKADFEAINRKMAETGKVSPADDFNPGEEVRDFRAG